MMRSGWLVVLVLAACSKAEPTRSSDPPDPGLAKRPPEVDVVLAGVTLADDCGEQPLPPPAASSANKTAASAAGSSSMPAATSERVSAGACAPGMVCGVPSRGCDQTAMQLAVRVPEGVAATTLHIKRVEWLDDNGKVLGTLTARTPSKWDGTAAYLPWDEAIPAGKAELVISYKLSAPDWSAFGGRWDAASKRFSLRVTVAVRDKDRTIEKQAIVPIMPEPAVST